MEELGSAAARGDGSPAAAAAEERDSAAAAAAAGRAAAAPSLYWLRLKEFLAVGSMSVVGPCLSVSGAVLLPASICGFGAVHLLLLLLLSRFVLGEKVPLLHTAGNA